MKSPPLLEARGIEKDYFSVMRFDAPSFKKLGWRLFGWSGALRSSKDLWDPRPILRGVDITVQENEILAITGRSGAGKSTLLHVLGTFDSPSRGEIFFRGRPLVGMSEQELSDFRNQHIGYVFQFYHLFKDLNAVENVLLPAMIGARNSANLKDMRARAEHLLDSVKLSHRKDHRPQQLSGGEQQRVAIARALLLEPQLLLCDEPTGNLDSETSQEILELLFKLRENEKRSYVIVTHDRDIAVRADRHIAMQDGKIIQE
jgi:lipoprotein-releasing system ATP-binding protein